MDQKEFLSAFPSKTGKLLYLIAEGRDLSKLDLKESSALSMSTVIGGVDRLYKEKWITLIEEKKESGGKPRSVINPAEDAFVCGISYKNGALTALYVDLRGNIRKKAEIAIADRTIPPDRYVGSVLRELSSGEKAPRALALAMNVPNPTALLSSLEKAVAAPVFHISNTAAIAALSLFREREYPVCALGVGVRIKCALYGETLQTADLTDLTAPCASGGATSYGGVLSVSIVERRLREEDFRGNYLFNGEKYEETRTKRAYSDSLVASAASLADIVATLTNPKRLILFGDYFSEGFFVRVQSAARYGALLRYFPVDREAFALGAAYYALKEGAFAFS